MLRNYLILTFRNLRKRATISIINILGLSLGVSVSILLLFYVFQEYSFDSFHTNKNSIYRAWSHEDYGNDEIYWGTITPIILKDKLDEELPEVLLSCRRVMYEDEVQYSNGAKRIKSEIQFCDKEFFQIFDFTLLRGNKDQVFKNKESLVLNERTAKDLFGNLNIIGEELEIKIADKFKTFIVSGIIEDAPANSSISYEILIPFENAREMYRESNFNSSL